MASHALITSPAQLAAVLRGHRNDRGLTQKQAGLKVGLLPKTVSALELDPGRSSVASLFKLLSALDLELSLQPKNQPSSRTTSSKATW
jgi:HTH-type transcriptional regulator/antitoxin HipB